MNNSRSTTDGMDCRLKCKSGIHDSIPILQFHFTHHIAKSELDLIKRKKEHVQMSECCL